MKTRLFLIVASIFSSIAFAEQGIDMPKITKEEALLQGRALIDKEAQKIEQATKSSNYANTTQNHYLKVTPDSPMLQQFSYSKDASREFMEYATGRKKIVDPSKRKYDFFVAISFSMPAETIKQYSKQAREYGATIVLKGMHKNSIRETQIAGLPMNPYGATWQVNPSVFKKFKITKVPSIVLADSSKSESVLEGGCAEEGDYLQVDGDVSIHHALVLMKQYGKGPLVKTAEDILATENQ